MADFIHRPAAAFLLVAGLGLFIAITVSGCAPHDATAATVDDLAILPVGASPKASYARSYFLATIKDTDSTPYFTTSEDFDLPEPKRFWVAVYVHSDALSGKAHSPFQLVTKADQMPMAFHGGCQVINLVADATTGKTLSSWCNIEDPQPSSSPTRVPIFQRGSSIFG